MCRSRSSSWEWRTSPASPSFSYSWALLVSALWELVQVRSLFIPLSQPLILERSFGENVMTLPSTPLSTFLHFNIRLTSLYYLREGTLAASFQSTFYGASVPAGSFFAKLTSMGMLGTLTPLFLGMAAVAAAVITGMVWKFRGVR